MTISPCSTCSGRGSSSAVQSQKEKSQTQSNDKTNEGQPQDSVQISHQALNMLKGIDADS